MAYSQTAPSASEAAAYNGLHAVAWNNDLAELRKLLASGTDPNTRDSAARTPLHVAAFRSHDEAVEILIKAGADPNALEHDQYDIVTIAAVANDPQLVGRAIKLGASARNITSIYDGTALIAAAHLGHFAVVKILIAAGAPLDHINNLGWTALIEAVVLGDGGARPRQKRSGPWLTAVPASQFPIATDRRRLAWQKHVATAQLSVFSTEELFHRCRHFLRLGNVAPNHASEASNG